MGSSKRVHLKEEKIILPGGGTRSEGAAPFYLVPRDGLRRIALRYGLGAEKHGADNWKNSCSTEENALVWCRMCYDHMMEHMLKMQTGDFPDDDHLGAIGWAQTQLAYVEEKFGKLWTSLNGVKK